MGDNRRIQAGDKDVYSVSTSLLFRVCVGKTITSLFFFIDGKYISMQTTERKWTSRWYFGQNCI